MNDPTHLTLIRHGQTTWNAHGRWQGQADAPLSAVGIQQAHDLAARLVGEQAHFDHIYTSDLQRAYDTAAILAEALRTPFQPLPALREIHVGVWAGLTGDEIKERYAAQWAAAQTGGRRGEHGESTAEFDARIWGGIQQVLHDHPGAHLALVSHGGAINSVLRLTLPHLEGWQHIRNTSLTTLVWDGTHWELARINDHRHLAEVSPVNTVI